MDYKEQTIELNKIPINEVAGYLGIKLRKVGSALCPFPDHNERNASFEIKKGGIRWECYSCNRKGGSIDFVSTYMGCDFISAKNWMVSHIGTSLLPTHRYIPAKSKPLILLKNQPRDSEVYEHFISLCPLQASGNDYLNNRGISQKTLDRFCVSQIDSSIKISHELTNKFGFERVKKSGLISKHSRPNNTRLFAPDEALIFPFFEDERIVYCQGRILGGVKGFQKWFNPIGISRMTYNTDALNTEDNEIAICEGVSDTLSAAELGYAAIALLGVSGELSVAETKKMLDKDVLILLDWDEPGESRASKLEAELIQIGLIVTRKSRPQAEINDLNEYLMALRGLQ